MREKSTSKYLWMDFIVISIFLINESIRLNLLNKVGKGESILQYNLMFIITMGYVVFICIKKRKINFKVFIIIFNITIFAWICILFEIESMHHLIAFTFYYLLPLSIFFIELSKDEKIILFIKFRKYLNVLVFFILGFAIIDYIMNRSLQLFLANNFFEGHFRELVIAEASFSFYRLYTPWGHPLHNAEIILMYYAVNSISNKYIKAEINPIILNAVTLLGLILCGSKTALILIVIFMAGTSSKKNKYLYMMLTIVILLVFLQSQFFYNNLYQRFLVQDLSSGRSALLKSVFSGQYELPTLLGKGYNYSRYVATSLIGGAASNFEYPLIMMAYDWGIVITALLYLMAFLYPYIKIMVKKKWYILFAGIIIGMYVNSYNSMANYSDAFSQLVIFNFLLIQVSSLGKEDFMEEI